MTGQDERAAAQQVVALFAAEALLALDRLQRLDARQAADRLAHWWQKLRMDDVGLDGTDAEQILAMAAEQSLDPENDFGLSLADATTEADNRAALEDRPLPSKGIADFRKDFEQAYGGQANVPAQDDDWLAQSLTRLARAAVLRDVVAQGAQVEFSEPVRAAADQLVEQGRQLMDNRTQQPQQPGPTSARAIYGRQAGLVAAFGVYCGGVQMTGAPPWAQAAMDLTGFAILVHETDKNRRAVQTVGNPGLDPQAQLRSVRADLINTLDTPTPTTRRDTRALRRPSTGPNR